MKTCFTIMPFGGYFDDYYNKVIKKIILKSEFSPLRADEIYGTGAIIEDIYKSISASFFCIADVTEKNPNVSYELGMAHTLGKPVIIITQNISDVPFDYSHLRIIEYDPKKIGWEIPFETSLLKTIKQVTKSPSDNLALNIGNKELKLLKNHLINIFFNVDCELSKYDQISCDKNGHATITTEWKVKANNDIFHLCHNLIAGKPGKIEIIKVYDKLHAKNLETLVLEEGEKHLSYFFMMKSFKKKNQTSIIESIVYVENYMDTLVDDGRAIMSHQAAVKSKIKYRDKKETYFFPKIELFSNVSAEYLSHPNHEKVGELVKPIETDEHYVLEVDYSHSEPYSQETGVLFLLK